MIKSKLVRGVFGKVRILDIRGHRHYVKRTNVKTWVVSTNQHLTLDTMVSINGAYHFNTLRELHEALNQPTVTIG